MNRTSITLVLLGATISLGTPSLRAQQSALDSPKLAARVEAILSQMTLEEKVGQLNQLSSDSLTGPQGQARNEDLLICKGQVGSILNSVSSAETNRLQKEAVEATRLHIPILFGYDVIHGFRTTFPIPLGLSASWDPQLVQDAARLAAREASSQGVRWAFSPMVDIARDPRWGRIAEGSGEDPYLGSVMARAYVRGYQGKKLSEPTSILACAKHFVGYGAAEGGRDYNTTEISERTLRDVYLPPFHAAVEEGAATLMSAFNSLDGVPSSANHFTLTTVLRGEWGFQGFVDSDWGAVKETVAHGTAIDEMAAAQRSFLAGVDMDMESNVYLQWLPGLVKSGVVPTERLDDAVRRILRIKVALGLFDNPYVPACPAANPTQVPASRALARKAAEESFVLLENRRVGNAPLLPITAAPGKRIAVIGPLAESAEDMLGCWQGQGMAQDVTTFKSAIEQKALAAGITVTFNAGTDTAGSDSSGFAEALQAARRSDLVIMTLGESGHSSGEASSRSRLDLPGVQEALLEAVVGTGKPVVLIAFSGRPLAIEWASRNVPAILMAWFPGIEAGPALVRTLFGDANPSGRLTVSIPRYVGQVPIYYNGLNTGRPRIDPITPGADKPVAYYYSGYIDEKNTALYPFGYGLSYTEFAYSGLKVDSASISAAALNKGEASLSVGADVRNSGSRAGTGVAQLYIRIRGTSVARPVRELKGFERVSLEPGETRHVQFTLGRDELSFWNIDMKRSVEPGALYLWVASDSASGDPVEVSITP